MNHPYLKLYVTCLKMQFSFKMTEWMDPLRVIWRESSVLKRRWWLGILNEFALDPEDDVYKESNLSEYLDIKKIAEEELGSRVDDIKTIQEAFSFGLCILFLVLSGCFYTSFLALYKDGLNSFIEYLLASAICLSAVLVAQAFVLWTIIMKWNRGVINALLRAENRIGFEVNSASRVRIKDEAIKLRLFVSDSVASPLERVNTQKSL